MEGIEASYLKDRSQLIEDASINHPRCDKVKDTISQTNATLRIAAFSVISSLFINDFVKGGSSFRDSLLTGLGSLTILSSAYYLDLSKDMQEDRDTTLDSTYRSLNEEEEKKLNPKSRKIEDLGYKIVLLSKYIFFKNTIDISDNRAENSVMNVEDLCFNLIKKYNIDNEKAANNIKINKIDFTKYVYRLIESHPDNDIRNLPKKEKFQLIDMIRSIGLDPKIIERNRDNTENNFHEDYLISKILKPENPDIFQFGERIYQLDQEILKEVLQIGFLTGFNIKIKKGTLPIYNQYISFLLKDYARYAYKYNRAMFNTASDESYKIAIQEENNIRKAWIQKKFKKNIGVGLISTLGVLSISRSDFIAEIIHTLTHI